LERRSIAHASSASVSVLRLTMARARPSKLPAPARKPGIITTIARAGRGGSESTRNRTTRTRFCSAGVATLPCGFGGGTAPSTTKISRRIRSGDTSTTLLAGAGEYVAAAGSSLHASAPESATSAAHENMPMRRAWRAFTEDG